MSETLEVPVAESVAVEKRPRNDSVTFVKTWQTSTSLSEVAKKLGITESSVTQRKGSINKAAKDQGLTINWKKFARKTTVRTTTQANLSELVAMANELVQE